MSAPVLPEPLATTREVAKALRLCDRSVRALVRDGSLPVIRLGRSVRFAPAAVRSYIAAATVPGSRRGDAVRPS